jgi:hypothetical protein
MFSLFSSAFLSRHTIEYDGQSKQRQRAKFSCVLSTLIFLFSFGLEIRTPHEIATGYVHKFWFLKNKLKRGEKKLAIQKDYAKKTTLVLF